MRNKCQTERRTTCSELKGDGGGMADGDLNLRAERTRRNTQHRQKRWCFRVCSHFQRAFRVGCPQQWTGTGLRHSEQEQILNNATFSGTAMYSFSPHSTSVRHCRSLSLCLAVSWCFPLFSPLRTQNSF